MGCTRITPNKIKVVNAATLAQFMKNQCVRIDKNITTLDIQRIYAYCNKYTNILHPLEIRNDPNDKYVAIRKNKNDKILVFAIYEDMRDVRYIHFLCKCTNESKSCAIHNLGAILMYWIIFDAQADRTIKTIKLMAASSNSKQINLMNYYRTFGFVSKNADSAAMILDLEAFVSRFDQISFEHKTGGKKKPQPRKKSIS